ncbi:hypothetical protein INR49_004736 [Caranx melampygus]|nr:hypothetical protein INR49_004736 [Caranx melampygus]
MIRLRMIIYHILLFCFLSALCGGNSGLVDANPIIFTGPEGGNGTVTCSFNEFAKWKFFCRGKCKENGILIKTDAASANYGRYRIRYKAPRPGKSTLTVIITNLVQSDAGRYSCGLGSTPVPDSLQDFDVKVSDGLLNKSSDFVLTNAEGQDIESPCRDAASRSRMFFCRGKCKNQEDILIETDQDKAQNGRYGIEYKNGSAFGQYVTITKAVKSDSGEYTCGYGRVSSPDSSYSFLLLVDTPTTSAPPTTQRFSSSSGSPTSSPVFPKTTNQPEAAGLLSPTSSDAPSRVLPVAVSVPVVGVALLSGFLMYLRKIKKFLE